MFQAYTEPTGTRRRRAEHHKWLPRSSDHSYIPIGNTYYSQKRKNGP